MNVVTVYLWLNGCEPQQLATDALEPVLLDAVKAGDFELLYHHVSENDGKVVALAVVGESHMVLHADVAARTLCAEVLSCTTKEAAEAALSVVRQRVVHASAADRWVNYDVDNGFD